MYYVVDDKGNKVEGYDKEGFLAVLQQAIDDGDLESIDADNAFVSKLKCCVGGGTFKVAFVTQANYNQLKADSQLLSNALYFITDDETEVNLEALIAELQTEVDAISGVGGSIENIVNGTTKIKLKDQNATGQELNMTTGVLKVGSEIVSKRRLLWSGEAVVSSSNTFSTISLSEDINDGDVLEIEYCYKPIATSPTDSGGELTRRKQQIIIRPYIVGGVDTYNFYVTDSFASFSRSKTYTFVVQLDTTNNLRTLNIGPNYLVVITSSSVNCDIVAGNAVYKVYKIIE